MNPILDTLQFAPDHEVPFDATQASSTVDKTVVQTQPARHRFWAYPTAIVLLLALTWFIYQHYTVVSTHKNEWTRAAQTTPSPLPLAGTSSISETTQLAPTARLPAPASDTNNSTHKTYPTAKNQRTKTVKPKSPPASLPSTDEPLKTAYFELARGRIDQSEQMYLQVLALHPHEKDALLGLAVIAQRKLQTARATSLYRQVLREDIGNTIAAAGLVYMSAAADTAESQLKELIDLKPTAPELHYALGGVMGRQLRWSEAQQAYFQAYNLAPDNALYAYNLAVSLDRLHQTSIALTYYEKAAALIEAGDSTLDHTALNRRIQQLSSRL